MINSTASGWTIETESLWFVGNQFASHVSSVSAMTAAEAHEWTNDLGVLGPAMRAAAFL